jgi:hypothetical protein
VEDGGAGGARIARVAGDQAEISGRPLRLLEIILLEDGARPRDGVAPVVVLRGSDALSATRA